MVLSVIQVPKYSNTISEFVDYLYQFKLRQGKSYFIFIVKDKFGSRILVSP